MGKSSGSSGYLGTKYTQKQFIREVQARPILWNPKAKDFNDNNTRSFYWLEIGEIFFDKPDGSNAEKADFAKKLQQKWRSLRDTYKCHMRRVIAGEATLDQYSNYKYLNFLDDDSDIQIVNAKKAHLEKLNGMLNADQDSKKPMNAPYKSLDLGSKFHQKKFIDEIQARRPLWDLNDDGYRDRNTRFKCWMEIVEIFYDKPDASDLEKDRFVKLLQRKWKGMRDHYRSHLNRIASGLPSTTPISSIYKHLKFLDNNYDRLNTNAQNDSSENTNTCLAASQESLDMDISIIKVENTTVTDELTATTSGIEKRAEESMDTMENSMSELENITESKLIDMNNSRMFEGIGESITTASQLSASIEAMDANAHKNRNTSSAKVYLGPKYNHKDFIKAVEDRPAIWDPRCENYNDKDVRSKCWMEIAEIFFHKPDDGNSGWTDKAEFRKTLQRKWKSIRDHYRIHTYRVKDGIAKFDQYSNSQYLTFLDRISDDMNDTPIQKLHSKTINLKDPRNKTIYLGKKYDQAKFVEEVKSRPALWNRNSEDYNDKITKARYWKEIFDIFYDNPNGSERAKRNFANAMQRKWRSMRDQYKKFQNRIKNGTATPDLYINFNYLSFLDDNTHQLIENISRTSEELDEAYEVLNNKWKRLTDAKNIRAKYTQKRLIQEVKIRPALWDFGSEDYRDRSTRAKCWMEVGEIFIDNPNADKTEKDAFVKVLQNRWKGIRDQHRKHMQRVESGSATHNQYYHNKDLKFLDECPVFRPHLRTMVETAKNSLSAKINGELKSRRDSDSLETENTMETVSGAETENTMETDLFIKVEDTYSDMEFYDIGDTQLQDFMDDVAENLPVNNTQQKHTLQSKQNDMDRWFLLSLIEPLKEVPEHLRLQVKVELMRIIENACSNGGNI